MRLFLSPFLFVLLLLSVGFSAHSEMNYQAPRQYTFVPRKKKDIVSAKGFFQEGIHKNDTLIMEPPSYTLKAVLKALKAYRNPEAYYPNRLCFFYPGIIQLPPGKALHIEGLLEAAGGVLHVPSTTTVSVKDGARLGLDTWDMYYEMPVGPERQNRERPQTVVVSGVLKVPVGMVRTSERSGVSLELNHTMLMTHGGGRIQLGLTKPCLEHGWHSENGTVVFYHSEISVPLFKSQGDTMTVIGKTTIRAPEASFKNTIVCLSAEDSYHASERIDSVNDTVLRGRGSWKQLPKKIIFEAGVHPKTHAITLPQVRVSGTIPDLSSLQIQITGRVLGTVSSNVFPGSAPTSEAESPHKAEPGALPASTSGEARFPLITCSSRLKGVPKLEETEFTRAHEVTLVLSPDGHTLEAIIKVGEGTP